MRFKKPIQIDRKSTYNSIEDIEFSLLEVLDNKESVDSEELKDSIRKINEYSGQTSGVLKFVGLIGSKEIWFLVRNQYYSDGVVEDFIVFDVGTLETDKKYLCLKDDYGSLVIASEFNEYLLEDEFIEFYKDKVDSLFDIRKEIVEGYGRDDTWRVELKDTNAIEQFIDCKNKDDLEVAFTNWVKQAREKYSEEFNGVVVSEEEFKKQKEDEEKDKKEEYEKNSVASIKINAWNTMEINGDTIITRRNKYVLEDNVNKFLEWGFEDDYRRNITNSYTSLNSFAYFLNDRKISYSYYKSKDDAEPQFKVKFKDDKVFVDNVQIPKSKIVFITSRADGTEEKVKLLKKLTGMAITLLGRTELKTRLPNGNWEDTMNIPISFDTDNGKDFKVSVMSKEFNVEFPKLKETFFSGYSFITPQIPELYKFLSELGISKEDFMEHLKRIKLLKDLAEDE